MIETARTLEEVAAKLAKLEPGVTVAGPNLNGGWGLTTRHNGYNVHLEIGQLHQRHDGGSATLIADGKLYLDPKPPDEGRPLADLVREGLPGNCALYGLPNQYVISKDPFQGDQVEWKVRIIVSGPGMGVPNLGQNIFFIVPQQPYLLDRVDQFS